MEEIQKKKGNTGLIVLVIFLTILLLGMIGYICYDKGVFDDLIGKEKTVEETKSEEKLIQGNQFRLRDIPCKKGEYSCTKNLKVAYNGQNHDIKIEYYQKIENDTNDVKSNNLYFKLYVDNKMINELKSGMLYLEPESNNYDLEYNMDFDGYIYIFNDKYLGFLMQNQYPAGSPGFSLTLYNNERQVGDVNIVDAAGQSFGDNGSGMDGIENIIFDGTMLQYWHLACELPENYNEDEYSQSDEGPNSVAAKLGLTFDGEQVNIKYQNEKKEVVGGGATGICFDINKNVFESN